MAIKIIISEQFYDKFSYSFTTTYFSKKIRKPIFNYYFNSVLPYLIYLFQKSKNKKQPSLFQIGGYKNVYFDHTVYPTFVCCKCRQQAQQ